MSELVRRLAESFIPMLSGVLKEDFTRITPDEAARSEVFVRFAVGGDVSGALVVCFAGAQAAARRFLEITIGDAQGAEVGEAAQEIGNQLIGRILGDLSDSGLRVEIAYPGELADAGELAALNFIPVAAGRAPESVEVLLAHCEEGQRQEQAREEAQGGAAAAGGRQKTVLIVDDSPVMCAFLDKIFTENGYSVVGHAADGVEAIEMFERHDPDLVTLDIVMPRLRGTEVLQRILQIRPQATVVMASSVSDARTVMNCLKMGAKRYIIKPYDKQAVIQAVEKALGIGGGA